MSGHRAARSLAALILAAPMDGTQWWKAAGTEFWGPVNASANGGARTGTQVLEDPSMKGGNVHAWITGDNGIVRARSG